MSQVGKRKFRRPNNTEIFFRILPDGRSVGCWWIARGSFVFLFRLLIFVLILCCRRGHLLALGRGVIDGAQRQRRRFLRQIVGVFEIGGGPIDGGDDFRHTHATVLVRVNQRERAFVKFESLDRTTQRDSKFLVKLAEVGDGRAGIEPHLIHAARAEKIAKPEVRLPRSWFVSFPSV
jgi:hypothetical protein